MRPISIRFKLTAWYVLVFSVVLACFCVSIYVILEKKLLDSVDRRLQTMAELISKTELCLVPNFLPPDFERRLNRIFGTRPVGKFVRVLDFSGEIGSRTDNLDEDQIPVNKDLVREVIARGEIIYETQYPLGRDMPIRFINFPVKGFNSQKVRGVVQVGTSLEFVRESMRNLLIVFFTLGPSLLFVAAAVGFFLAGKALKPIREIARTARHITVNNLQERITVPVARDDIGQLATTINGMLDRLSLSFQKITQFTTDASHELRTPLTIMRGELEIALRGERSSEEYQETLGSSLEEVERMSKIVNDLLFLSKSDMGQEELHSDPVDLRALLLNLLPYFKLLAEEHQLELESSLAEVNSIYGDQLKLRQMVINLLSNAIRYTPAGGHVNLGLKNLDDGVEIMVADTGIGIPEEAVPRIFDRFYRADKARSRQFGGSGLGLSIVKWIVDAHHGVIKVDSVVGEGSVFRVFLPGGAPVNGGLKSFSLESVPR
ncbi:MAG: HAMP domain-containing protein [Deltaproteobacteria bacterium]|nr:HAMP domain-containing protein [Deltaproteobacteria bacterium]